MSETRKTCCPHTGRRCRRAHPAGVADKDRILARLRSDLIDPIIALHHGRTVKRTGDGSLIEFRSVIDAGRCAIEGQNGLIDRSVFAPNTTSCVRTARTPSRRGPTDSAAELREVQRVPILRLGDQI